MSNFRWNHTGRFCASSFLMDMGLVIFLLPIPFLAMEFGAESLQLGLLGGVREGVYGVTCIAAGFAATRKNRRLFIALSVFSAAAICATTGAATELWHLFAISALWAAVIAFFWPQMFAWVADSHTGEELGGAIGSVNLSWSVGGMIGALAAGSLYDIYRWLPFSIAALLVLLVYFILVTVRDEGSRANKQDHQKGRSASRGEIAAAWLGNMAGFCLFGVMFSVFPKLGVEKGITIFWFSVLFFANGMGRSLVFLTGIWKTDRILDWRFSAGAQLVALAMVATIGYAQEYWWFLLLFGVTGMASGLAYYRSLYISIAGEGRRELLAALHEGLIFGGLITGSIGGGIIAHIWGLQAPYMPIAGLAFVLLLVQAWLIMKARRAEAPAS